MPSIKIVLTGPYNGPSSFLRFNAALSDGVLLLNLAAALSLGNVDQLDTVRFTSLGYGLSHASMGEMLRYLMSRGVEEGAELGLKVVAGVVYIDWAVKGTAAASQQVQLVHPTPQAAFAALTAPSTATDLTPDSQCSGEMKGSGKKQPWHSFARQEMALLPRVLEDGEVGGQAVKKGQFVQVRQKGLDKAQSELVHAVLLCASKRTLCAYQHHRERDKTINVQTLDKIMQRFGRVMRNENGRLAAKRLSWTSIARRRPKSLPSGWCIKWRSSSQHPQGHMCKSERSFWRAPSAQG